MDENIRAAAEAARRAEEAAKSVRDASGEAGWKSIEHEFGVTKIQFGIKIKFIKERFKREIIFRDIGQAQDLVSSGFSKPALILAGGVIEEMLRLYLKYKNIRPEREDFNGYIEACEKHGLLKHGVSQLSHSVRQFRNLVHLSAEEKNKDTISKVTAIGALSSIFIIANDF